MQADRGQRGRYHHGDLPAALRAAALELVGERGVQGFTLAEAARRVGVTGAAPYRHYADRDALLAALAVEGYQLLAARLDAVPSSDVVLGGDARPDDGTSGWPRARLAGMAAAYVAFAGAERARFQVLFGAGLDKYRHPEVQAAAEAAFGLVEAEVARLPPHHLDCLARDLWALAHGYACLAEAGPDGAVDASAADAARSAAARLLTGSGST